ncbi:MAG: hypothetical protein GF317_25185 [Candidatus Lokiarchaeota archaeon]|nr:hypothetical protein [Candidatus Lokiarchaeota archaeon]MBD3202653.1 hypothetical protein [Candidatus Lokiarchaeota archaeon]
MLDDLSSQSQNFEIDWLLHSRGNLTVGTDGQSISYKVPSYLSNDIISLNTSFLGNIKSITEGEGVFCPKNYKEGDNYPDVDTSYIKARYSGNQNPIMASILYPKNDSDISQAYPLIIEKQSDFYQIGDNDYIYYADRITTLQTSSPKLNFTGTLLFMRQNESAANDLEYYFLQSSKKFEFESNFKFYSTRTVSNFLISYENNTQISGYINSGPTQITLSTSWPVQMLKLNGQNQTFTNSSSQITFQIQGPSSFVISKTNNSRSLEKNYLTEDAPTRVIPSKSVYGFDLDLLSGLSHPYILFNQTELVNFRNKINDPTKPWFTWYNEYLSDYPNIDDVLINDPNLYEDDQRYHNVYNLLLKFAIENNQTALEKIKDYLLDMESLTHYSSDLRRAKNVRAYATAYDIVYNNLSVSEQTTIGSLLYSHAAPLMRMDLYHRNNHRVVDAGALGMAGLALKNKEMIDIAQHTILDYFYVQNPADGGSFEGYSYISFALYEIMTFISGLKKLSAFNFFEDEKIIATLDYIAETLGPLGMPGSFEDCTFDKDIQEVLLYSAAQMNDTDPSRAQRYQYIWEQRQNNTQYSSSSIYGYLKGEDTTFERIVCYSVNDTITSKPVTNQKEVWKESSMAFLRSGDQDGLFMPFSCKNYDQNHPHQDENSFELWAFGAYIANNPGYPGWGKKFHTWAQSTEGANSLLIGGSGQLQVEANGLSSSISSPYFSMVYGEGSELYNDTGSFNYAPEPYLLLIGNFAFLFIVGISFIMISTKKDIKLTRIDKLKQKVSSTTKKVFRSDEFELPEQELSKLKILNMLFLHPFRLQRYLNQYDYMEKYSRFIRRFISFFLIGLMMLIFLISCIDVNNTIIYHSQYHEDKYNIVFDILPYVILGIFTIGTLLIGLITFGFIKLYGSINKFLVRYLQTERPDISKAKLKISSRMSSFWTFPLIIFSGFVIYLTTVQQLNVAIHGLWTELNSINDVYDIVVTVLIGVIYNFGYILIFSLPFLVLSVALYSTGINLYTENHVSKRDGWKISLTSLLIVLTIVFMIYIVFYLIFKALFSLITIEAIVSE